MKDSELVIFKDFSGQFPDYASKQVRELLVKFWDENVPLK